MQNNTLENLSQDEIVKAYGVFIGLINKVNKTNISVQKAMSDETLLRLFDETIKNTSKIVANHSLTKKSTKGRSYDLLNLPEIDERVLITIYNNPNSTRTELASISKISLCTLTGAVTRLIDNGVVFISGEKYNNTTQRSVQTLSVIGV